MNNKIKNMLTIFDEIQSEWLAGNSSMAILSTGYLGYGWNYHYILDIINDYWRKSRIKPSIVMPKVEEEYVNIWELGIVEIRTFDESCSVKNRLFIDPYISACFGEKEPMKKDVKIKNGKNWDQGMYDKCPLMCAGDIGYNSILSSWSVHGTPSFYYGGAAVDTFVAYSTKSKNYIVGSYRTELYTSCTDNEFKCFIREHAPVYF